MFCSTSPLTTEPGCLWALQSRAEVVLWAPWRSWYGSFPKSPLPLSVAALHVALGVACYPSCYLLLLLDISFKCPEHQVGRVIIFTELCICAWGGMRAGPGRGARFHLEHLKRESIHVGILRYPGSAFGIITPHLSFIWELASGGSCDFVSFVIILAGWGIPTVWAKHAQAAFPLAL